MFVFTLTLLTTFASVANAHFHLLYPPPRGDFVAAQEPNYCGGYTNPANRSTFPLSDGFFSIKSGHPAWTAGILISTAPNPESFDQFKANGQDQLVLNYFTGPNPGTGTFCLPLDIAAANITGAVDGANVTIQVIYQATDGNLYQCADLTLSKSFKIDSNVSCVNDTTAATSNSTNSTSSGNSGAVDGLSASQIPMVLSAVLGLLAFALF